MTQAQYPAKLFSKTDSGIAALIFLLALALYTRTLAPSLLWGDSAEFQVLSYTLGMTHPSGYMTHIMLGKLFTLIPYGSIAWRVNFMSAFFGAWAVALIYLIVRAHGGRRAAAVSGALLAALMEGFWWRALISESYAIAAGFIASVWLLVLLWEQTKNTRYLFLAGLLGGLALGIHSTIVMTGAGVLAFLIFKARTRSAWLGAAIGALLGLTLTLAAFLYVDYNDPPSSVYNTVYRPSLSLYGLAPNEFDSPFERLFAIFPANHFWSYYFSAPAETINARLVEYFRFFHLWQFILVIVGALTLFFERRWAHALYAWTGFLLIWGLGVSVAFSIYREFYVPVTVIVGVWGGLGASAALGALERLMAGWPLRAGLARFVLALTSLSLVIVPLWQSRADLSLAARSGYTSFIQRDHIYAVFAPEKAIQDATKVLRRVDENAIVFADWDKLYSLIYTALFDADRPDITFAEALTGEDLLLSETTLEYIDANIETRPIYFTIDLPQLSELYRLEQIGDGLFQIHKK